MKLMTRIALTASVVAALAAPQSALAAKGTQDSRETVTGVADVKRHAAPGKIIWGD
jgi:hypothetical protein